MEIKLFMRMSYLKMITYILLLSESAITAKKSKLLQVHVLFRHGDRNPERGGLYPNDPHLNDTWAPEGLGGLTKLGKMQAYNIGRFLRINYDQFLGKIYTPKIMEARSTNLDRVKMSLQLVLAGLWPPESQQIWNDQIPWQPIPYNSVSMEFDEIFRYPFYYCENYMREYRNVIKLKKFQHFLTMHKKIIEYINYNTGTTHSTVRSLLVLHSTLFAENRTGRKLPKWTEHVFPSFLEIAGNLEYHIQTYNDKMLRLGSGPLIAKIITDAQNKMIENPETNERKLFLYSAHEYNIAFILAGLKLFNPHIPPYASYVIIEFHKLEDQYGFKIFYQDHKHIDPTLLTIPECDSFCPFDKFVKSVQHILPNDETCK